MAVTRVRWTRGALADLVAIGRYIEQDNPQAARSVVHRVELAGNSSASFRSAVVPAGLRVRGNW
jgi:plasmid stabilization system protein ParE